MRPVGYVALVVVILAGCSSGEQRAQTNQLAGLGFSKDEIAQIAALVQIIDENAPSRANPATTARDLAMTQAGVSLLKFGARITPFLEDRYRKASENPDSEGVAAVYGALLMIGQKERTAQSMSEAPPESLLEDICTVTEPDFNPDDHFPVYKAGQAAQAYAHKGPDALDALVDRILQIREPPAGKGLGIYEGLGEGPAITISIVAGKWPSSPAPARAVERLTTYLLSDKNTDEYINEYVLVVLNNLTRDYDGDGYTDREKDDPLAVVLLNCAKRLVREGGAHNTYSYERGTVGYKMHSWGLDIVEKLNPGEAAQLQDKEQ